jgi:2'-hydroxyisoflavone reductase
MRILVIGGSVFLGRHIVRSALEAGHEVTLFNRGQTDPDAFAEAEKIRGDRNGDLSGLEGREWDATIDVCAFVPRQVSALLRALGGGAGHYTFISTVSVYAETAPAGFVEEAELVAPSYEDTLTMESYGALKVGCELTAREAVGDRLLIVRPGYIVGPNDLTHRFTYWVERCAAGGLMLGPSAGQPLQVIDVRDLADFVVACAEHQVVGTYHTTAPYPAFSFATFLEQIAEGICAPAPEVRWHEANDLLPLSAAPDEWPLMTADPAKARAAGLSWRPLGETARDTLAWVSEARNRGTYQQSPDVGMTPDHESALLESLADQDR